MEHNIIAIDPGLTIGLAQVYVVNSNIKHTNWSAYQTKEVFEADNWLEDHSDSTKNILLIEDYVGAGVLTKEAKETIMRLGFFKLYYGTSYTYSVETPTPQKRKAFVSQATELCKSRDIPGPHSADALAHILAWMKRENVQSSIL